LDFLDPDRCVADLHEFLSATELSALGLSGLEAAVPREEYGDGTAVKWLVEQRRDLTHETTSVPRENAVIERVVKSLS